MSVDQIIAAIVQTMEQFTTNLSTTEYCEVLQGVIDEFQQRHDVAEQEASAS